MATGFLWFFPPISLIDPSSLPSSQTCLPFNKTTDTPPFSHFIDECAPHQVIPEIIYSTCFAALAWGTLTCNHFHHRPCLGAVAVGTVPFSFVPHQHSPEPTIDIVLIQVRMGQKGPLRLGILMRQETPLPMKQITTAPVPCMAHIRSLKFSRIWFAALQLSFSQWKTPWLPL